MPSSMLLSARIVNTALPSSGTLETFREVVAEPPIVALQSAVLDAVVIVRSVIGDAVVSGRRRAGRRASAVTRPWNTS